MLKSFHNRTTIQALTPWATEEHQELGSLLPEIMVKKKKKKTKKQNLENKPSSDFLQSHVNQQFNSKEKFVSLNKQLLEPTGKHQAKLSLKENQKQNDLNFIKKSNKSKSKIQSKNKQILDPKPLTSERKYVRSLNYLTLEDQMNQKFNLKNQLLFKDIMETQVCKTDIKKSQDIHSLYLIEKLKAISNTHEPLKNKDRQQKSKKFIQNPFLDYLTQNNGIRQHEKRVLTQRGPKQFSLKTQGSDSEAKNQLNFLKNTKDNTSLTHRKIMNNFSLLNNQQSTILWSEKENFNIESTFALKTSTVLKQCKEANSMEMKNSHNKSNLIRPSKLLDKNLFEDQNLESKFSGIDLENKPSKKLTSSLPLQPINYELNQMQSTELPAMKSKVTFLIQKSQFSVKPSANNRDKPTEKDIPFEEQVSAKMQQEMKRNLRKLRGYLVKKTRDQCMEKGHLDENELILYESNRNHFATE